MGGKDAISAYLSSTGVSAHVGTIYLQLSHDKSNFANHPTSIAVTAVAIAADQTWTDIAHPYVRFFFDRTAGVDTEFLTVKFHIPARG